MARTARFVRSGRGNKEVERRKREYGGPFTEGHSQHTCLKFDVAFLVQKGEAQAFFVNLDYGIEVVGSPGNSQMRLAQVHRLALPRATSPDCAPSIGKESLT